MTADHWLSALLFAVSEAEHGDSTVLYGFAQMMEEADAAKQLLRDAGFGCTGVSLLRTAEEAVAWIAGAHNSHDGAEEL